jgi:hypothetical protein
MTDEPKPTKEETLAEMKRRIKELESEVDTLKKKEEGWLVWTRNPMFSDKTMSVQFTDGMAFIQKDRVYPEGDARKVVRLLELDFGYQSQYFTKDEMDELQKRISQRALERKEVEAKMGTQADMMEKLLQSHHM